MIPGFLGTRLGFCGVGRTLIIKLHESYNSMVVIPLVYKQYSFGELLGIAADLL